MARPLEKELLDTYRGDVARIKEQARAQWGGLHRWDLTGKNAIVSEGKSITIRLLPRWDYRQSVTRDKKTGKTVPNPNYRANRIFVEAYEHWYNRPKDNQRVRVWCPKTFERDAACPICAEALALRGSATAEDRDTGKDIAAKSAFIFQAVVGKQGARRTATSPEGGRVADIRALSVQEAIYRQVIAIMTGDEEEGGSAYALGHIEDPKQGHDLLFSRPAKQEGARWILKPRPEATRLYEEAEKEAFAGWSSRLVDLEEAIRSDTPSVEKLALDFFGDANTVHATSRPALAAPAQDFPDDEDEGVEVEEEETDAEETDAEEETDEDADEAEETDAEEETDEDADEAEEPQKASAPDIDADFSDFDDDQAEKPTKKKAKTGKVVKMGKKKSK